MPQVSLVAARGDAHMSPTQRTACTHLLLAWLSEGISTSSSDDTLLLYIQTLIPFIRYTAHVIIPVLIHIIMTDSTTTYLCKHVGATMMRVATEACAAEALVHEIPSLMQGAMSTVRASGNMRRVT